MALFTTAIEPSTASIENLPADASQGTVICKNPEKLQSLIAALENNSIVHYVSDGEWSLHNLVDELLKKYHPADVYMTTYAIRELSARQLVFAQDKGYIRSLNLIIDHRAKVRTPEVFQLVNNIANRIRLKSIHAKVVAIHSELGDVCVVTSSNFTSNPRIEAGIVTTDPLVVRFHSNWINKVIDEAEIFE